MSPLVLSALPVSLLPVKGGILAPWSFHAAASPAAVRIMAEQLAIRANR
jgi:hypothetical protein